MGLARKAAESVERKLKNKPGSSETGDIDAVSKIGEQTAQSVYRVSAREEMERVKTAELLKILEESYEEMVDTLKAFGFKDRPPSKTEVMEAVKSLGPAMLEVVGRFGKPTILITPKGSFASKVKAIDQHKKFSYQSDTFWDRSAADEIWGGNSEKTVVSIVDGLEAMPQPSYITNDLNIRRKIAKYEEEFAKQSLEIMSCQEGAMLIMQSIKGGEPVDDVDKTKTITYYNRNLLIEGACLPCGCWDSGNGGVNFYANVPTAEKVNLRCRPSVKVMEI